MVRFYVLTEASLILRSNENDVSTKKKRLDSFECSIFSVTRDINFGLSLHASTSNLCVCDQRRTCACVHLHVSCKHPKTYVLIGY